MYYSMENQQIATEPTLVSVAGLGLGQDEEVEIKPVFTLLRVIGYVGSTAGTIAGAYHGYKRARKRKILNAFWYSFIGSLAWPIVIPIMFAQGFGKPKAG